MADLWSTAVCTCCGPPIWDRSKTRTPLHLLSTVTDGLRRVAVGGELDLAMTPLLDAAVAEAFRGGSAAPRRTPGRFHLDLAGVSFLDVSALNAFRRIEALARRRGEELSVVAPVASGPRRLLLFAVGTAWLSPAFTPSSPADGVA